MEAFISDFHKIRSTHVYSQEFATCSLFDSDRLDVYLQADVRPQTVLR